MRAHFAFGFVVVTVFSATLLCACDINPQPEVPSDDDDGTGGEAGATNALPPSTDDDRDQEYDELDPNVGSFSDKTADDAPDSGREQPDAGMPPPYDRRDDAGVPGVVN